MTSILGMEKFVRVLVRLSPAIGGEAALQTEETSLLIQQGGAIERHEFDKCLSAEASQSDLLASLDTSLIDPLLFGINVTLLCCGGPASGKRFSLFGSDGVHGLVQLVTTSLFERLREPSQAGMQREYSVHASYALLDDEAAYDLFDDHASVDQGTPVDGSSAARTGALQLRRSSARGVYIDGLTKLMVEGGAQMAEILLVGEQHRLERASAGSHAIFELSVALTLRQVLCTAVHSPVTAYPQTRMASPAPFLSSPQKTRPAYPSQCIHSPSGSLT